MNLRSPSHFAWLVPLALVGGWTLSAAADEPAAPPRPRDNRPPRAEGEPRFDPGRPPRRGPGPFDAPPRRPPPPRQSDSPPSPVDFSGPPRVGGPFPGALHPRSMEQEDPEMYALIKADDDLGMQSYGLAEQVRKATGDERTKLKQQLEDLLNKHFDVRQQRRQLQIKRMEEELKRLQEAVEKRSESREALVRQRIAELLGEQADLGF